MLPLAVTVVFDIWTLPLELKVKSPSDASSGPALRTPGLIAPLLPFATFIGVLWSEVAHTQSGERMLVWNSGRSPLQCLAPVLLVGLILGTADFVMDAWLGPSSMGIQMAEQLGRDGERLSRTKWSKPAWMAAGGGILRAEIEYGPPPVLRNVMFFARDENGKLGEVDVAPAARWQDGTDNWVLQKGQFWKPGTKGEVTRTVIMGKASRQTMTPFDEKAITLAIDPLWFTWYDLQPQYIPLPVLAKLAASDRLPDAHGQYATRLHVVLAEALLPGLMALLASSLAMLLIAYRTSAPALVGIVFAGYIAHFGTKACLIMGQNGYMNPMLAGWLVPVGLIAAVTGVFAVIEIQRKKQSKFSDG